MCRTLVGVGECVWVGECVCAYVCVHIETMKFVLHGARGKRRVFSPGAAARHSQSAKVPTDCFNNYYFSLFSSKKNFWIFPG